MTPKSIEDYLDKIEESSTVLLAVESGSRVWGNLRPDSDYDLRFVYIPIARDHYLTLFPGDGHITDEFNEGNTTVDVVGWGIKKTLQLLYSSNPQIYEWLASPTVYLVGPSELVREFQFLAMDAFDPERVLAHYRGIALSSYYKRFADDPPKKYFYVLRSILAYYHVQYDGELKEIEYSRLFDSIYNRGYYIPEVVRYWREVGLDATKSDLDDFITRFAVESDRKYHTSPKIPVDRLNKFFQSLYQ